jgi:hypothetical protein
MFTAPACDNACLLMHHGMGEQAITGGWLVMCYCLHLLQTLHMHIQTAKQPIISKWYHQLRIFFILPTTLPLCYIVLLRVLMPAVWR